MNDSKPTILVFPTPEDVARRAAEAVVEAAETSIAASDRFVLALSGGSTPKRMYEILATEMSGEVDWDRVYLVFGDERCVPPTDPNSNYRMVHGALLVKVPIDPSHVLRVRGEDGDNVMAAKQYNAQLRSLLGDQGALDLALLGMGADGHTASLFTVEDDRDSTVEFSTSELAQAESSTLPKLVVPAFAPPSAPVMKRVTLSYAAIRAAERVFCLVTATDKAARLKQALGGAPYIPIGRVVRERAGRMQFFVDAAAGAGLES